MKGEIDYVDMGCDPEDDQYCDPWDIVDTCVDCGRVAAFGYSCDVCGAPLCGMCYDLGLSICSDCAKRQNQAGTEDASL